MYQNQNPLPIYSSHSTLPQTLDSSFKKVLAVLTTNYIARGPTWTGERHLASKVKSYVRLLWLDDACISIVPVAKIV